MNIIMLIIGIMLLVASITFTLRQWFPSAITAFAALVVLHFSTYICLPISTFAFWGVASLIALGIVRLSPKGEPGGTSTGNLYLTAGALAGLFVGIAVDARVMILCAIFGTFFGLLAFARTPKGCWIKFPSSNFIHYFCAKGMNIIVTVAMTGIAIEGFIKNLGR
ncbi:MAG: hypothetical protein ACI4UN_02030 [Muribaculaceae bacterium]